MAGKGLTAERIVEAAGRIADDEGPHAVSIARLADHFGVKAPSLYHHVDGLEDVMSRLAVATVEDLAETCRSVAMGRSGPDALRRLAVAYRQFAHRRPGTYPLTQVARQEASWQTASERALQPFLAVLAGIGIEGAEAIHAVRALRSALHGFLALEQGGGFGIELSPEESFQRLVDWVIAGISGRPPG